MAVLIALLTVVVALLALLVAGVLRSHAEILRALNELGVNLDPNRPAGTASGATVSGGAARGVTVPRPRQRPGQARSAVDVTGTGPGGDAVHVGVTGAEHGTLLAFLTSGCSTCGQFWEAFAAPDALHVPGDARLVVVTKDGGEESQSRVRALAPGDVPVVMSSAAWTAYDVPVAPYFVYADGPSGQVLGEGAAATWENVAALLDQALEDAGLEPSGRGDRSRVRPRADAVREARADRDLMRAGILPGDPSLFPQAADDVDPEGPTRAERRSRRRP